MRYQGIGASEGVAVGEIVVFRHCDAEFESGRSSCKVDFSLEMERFRLGRENALADIAGLFVEAKEKFGEEKAGIFEGYLEILSDNEIEEMVREFVDGGQDAESAVRSAFSALAAEFAQMEGSYMRERASDIGDIGRRLAAHIAGRLDSDLPVLDKPCVLVADDLSPAETVRLDLSFLRGLVVDCGGVTSHVAILARSLGIPCIVGLCSVSAIARSGALCAINGTAGFFEIDPDSETVSSFLRLAGAQSCERDRLRQTASLNAFTRDGVRVRVCANIGSPDEAGRAKGEGADGVGLFRTEFLFMNGETLPSEDEQYKAYRSAAAHLCGLPLVIRTLDIGGDKDLPHLGLSKEENPFLGYRAIRVGLDCPDILKPQLRAVLRASAHGKVELMFPMVISVEELRRLKAILAECRTELAAEGVPVGEELPVGVMIETPAAALMARELASEVDFFSIGTNDLTQYTLAVDRGNARIAALYDPCHPAVLRLISATCESSFSAGIPVCMCGEFASDLSATALLVGLGLNELSVSSARVSAVKAAVRLLDFTACRELARKALSLGTVGEIRELLSRQEG